MKVLDYIKKQSVFVVSLAVALFVIVFGLLCNESLNSVSSSIMSWVSINFGWLYVFSVFAFCIFLLFVAFSKYGKLKLGKDDDKPKYGNFSWYAMLFCGGTGIGLVFWSIAEPLSHYVSPPAGIEAGTAEAADFSMRISFLHWGVTQWACFAIVGLALAYFQFRKGKKALISNTLQPLVGQRATDGFFGKAIDIFSVIVSFAGVATSLGLGVSQICGGLNFLAGIPNTKVTWFWVILIVMLIFLASALSGVSKGIKLLSNINTYLAFALLILAFIVGPKSDILNNMITSVGQHMQNFFGDVLMIDSSDWIMNWRVFYYAWFIAWTPFVGMFIAQISKGRTVREFIIGVVIIPTVFTIIWLSVFGTIALNASEHWTLTELVNMVASPETAVFIVLGDYPLAKVISGLVVVLLAIFFITSADSATYSLSMMTSNGSINPPIYKKIVWAIVEAAIAFLLLSAGSLKPLQTISIAASLPFLFVMIAMCFSFIKDAKKESFVSFKSHQAEENKKILELNQDAKRANIQEEKVFVTNESAD